MFWRIEVFLNKGLFNKKFRKRVQLGFSFSSADIAFLTWYDGCWNLQEDESDEDKLPPVVSTKFQTASVVNLVTTLFKKLKSELWGSKTNWRWRFSLSSIILADLLGNRSLLQRVQKVMLCDLIGGFRSILCVFVCQGSLLVIIIMTEGSEKRNCKADFWTSEFACLWKAQ